VADETANLTAQLTPPSPVDTRPLEADRARDVATAESRQKALDQAKLDTANREEKELGPLEARESKQLDELSGLKPPKPTELPKWEPKPVVDPKDFQAFSYALLGMALIGGAVSRGNWLGVSSSLNGALQGYLDGAKERADREFKDYQTKFKEAQAHDEQAQREFENILTDKNNSIRDIETKIKVAAAKYGREDIRAQAEQHSIDGIWRQVEATDRSLASIQQHNDSLAMQFQLGKARLDRGAGGPGMDLEAPTNANAKWIVEQLAAGGNDKPLRELQSRYGGPVAMAVWNDIGAEFQRQNIDPRTLTQMQLDNAVQLSTQRQISQRSAGVQRLTESIKQIEGEVTRLTEKVNAKDPRLLNKGLNKIASEIGSEDVAELKTLLGSMGRQYMEAVTMPGSNAQLHATAQEWADGQFDPNMNIASLKGTLKAINFEIAATSKALGESQAASGTRVENQGVTLPKPGAAPQANLPTATPAPTPATPPQSFATEAEAAAAGLQPGTKVIVGGVPGTWQ